VHTIRIRVEAKPAGGYRVRLLSGAEGNPTGDEPTEDLPADLDRAAAPAALPKGAVAKAVQIFLRDNEEEPEFVPIGEFLGSLLLPGKVGERWDELRHAHSQQGLRTVLEVEPDELRPIPWELIRRNRLRLFIDQEAPWLRAHGLQPDESQELVPLRLLVVEGERDSDLCTATERDGKLGTAAELRGIKAALPAFKGRIDAFFLREPTPAQLEDAVKTIRPHIFHFLGHGMPDPATGEPGLRIRGWPATLTAQYVGESLKPMPRLAVLNACRSGVGVTPGQSLSPSQIRTLAEAFLDYGAAAVVGMQGDVRGSAAGLFGAGLYGALAAGQPVDQAVASARRRVDAGGGNPNARNWALPSLTARVCPEQVLPLACGISEADQRLVEDELFEPIKLFVDRTEARAKLAGAADPDDGPPERVVLIVGHMGAGKTWLVNWIRTRCAFRGRRVRYVDFRDKKNLDFIDALTVIRDTSEDVPSLAVPAARAFCLFNYELGFLVNGEIPVEPPGEVPCDPPELPRDRRFGQTGELILESFRTALGAATAHAPLLLIFDHVDAIKSDFETWIYPHLIARLDTDLPNVRLIVVLSSEERANLWPSNARRVRTEVAADLIPPEEYCECAEELVLALFANVAKKHERVISTLTETVVERWEPKLLQELEGIVARLGP
jgi:hypothetical protein